MSAININKEILEEVVMKSDKPVLVDFWAPWCGPCRSVLPLVEEIAQERDDIKVCKVNVDEEMKLARQFKVMSIPTLMVVNNGEIVKRVSGALNKHEIMELL